MNAWKTVGGALLLALGSFGCDAGNGAEGDGGPGPASDSGSGPGSDGGPGSGGPGSDGSAGGDGGSGSADLAGPGDTGGTGISGDTTPSGAPTWSAQFTAADSSLFTQQNPAQITLGMSSAAGVDQQVAQLLFPGSAALGPTDKAGPAYATELDSKATDFHYGMYRTRVQLASCSPTEDVVNGIFTYFNDGQDHNGDGIVDNSEIDIEILCGSPSFLSLTVWSQYSSDTNFRKWTRAVDLETGDIWESPDATHYGIVKKGNDPAFKHPGFFGADTFYEMGFEWAADHIRYFIVLDGKEITLWNFTDTTVIPTLPAAWLFNVWHPNEHWYGPAAGDPADYPATDALMRLDWARYWKQ